MSKNGLFLAIGALLVVILMQSIAMWMTGAAQLPAPPATPDAVTAALAPFGEVTEVQFDQEAGLYRVTVGQDIVYVTPNGKFAVAGDLYNLATQANRTEKLREAARQKVLAGLDPSTAITFAPEGETKNVVWVFTDVDCPYCQRFHQQIDDYTARGIEVRYLAFPRAGPDTANWREMAAVWCADDPRAAMTSAKKGAEIEAKGDCDAPIQAHYEAGLAVGLQGTPMILTPEGRVVGGYLGPEQLAARLTTGG